MKPEYLEEQISLLEGYDPAKTYKLVTPGMVPSRLRLGWKALGTVDGNQGEKFVAMEVTNADG